MPTVLFSKENAAAFGRRGWAIRRQREVERAAQIAAAGIPPIARPDFETVQLLHTRTLLQRIYALLDAAKAHDKIDRLTAAAERLWRVEFGLAGRPWPGNRRPGRDRMPEKPVWDIAPLSIGPAPLSQPVPQPMSPADSAVQSDPKPETPQP